MAGSASVKKSASRVVFLTATTALACVLAGGANMTAFAQSTDDLKAAFSQDPNARLLLVSDELVYDRDNELVIAQGSVQIDYGGTKLVARKVTYNQKNGRLNAEGNVEIVEKDGNRIYAESIDITDDFADGFVNALRVETTENTRFAAESAERTGGNVTTFNQGVYTACEPCRDNPEKAPVWQIKSRKIIWNGQEKTVRFEGARFELFGMPLATLPSFEIADPTVKRKTGFLFPGIQYKSELGAGLTVPFYVALAPNYDLLLSSTIYSKQGFLGEAEFRHRLDNGMYSLRVAGIHQANPDAFDAGTVDRLNTDRAMIGSKGRFTINPRWTFGWDVMAQTDKNFSKTYGIDGFSDHFRKNEIYLTGLSGRNYLDFHAYKFDVQEQSAASLEDDRQPYAGVIDYSWTAPRPLAGGELNFDFNARGIHRDVTDTPTSALAHNFGNLYGAEGTTGRFSAEAEWKRTLIAPGGLALTPIFAVRGDGDLMDTGDLVRSQAMRGMATAGMDLRWPVLFSTSSSTHILEPVAQVFVRNNERHAGQLPNEDAQSFVFDTSTLFERDKFSGWDRMEGGSRANLGLRYSGTFANGWTANAMIGQSYHLGGTNSFASPDLVDAGNVSGLETDVSDVVASLGIANSTGFMAALRGRFDEKTAEIRRAEAEVAYSGEPVSASVRYAFIQSQPGYGYAVDRQEVSGNVGVKFHENWRMFGATTYDIENEYFSSKSIGVGYDDSCTALTVTYAQTRSMNSAGIVSQPKHSIGFNLSLRTLGDIGSAQSSGGF